jgi:hypothetical protein
MRAIHKKVATAAAVGAVALTGAGVAYSYWSTSGSGSGSSSTSAGQLNTLTFSQASLTAMFPGDSSQTLTTTVTNTGPENVYVSGVKAYVTTDKSGCTGADYLLGGTAAPIDAATARALTWTAQDLAKTTGHADATSTIQFNNTGSNQDACKSATVTVHYLAS